MHELLPIAMVDKLSGGDLSGSDIAAVVITGMTVVFIGLVLLVLLVMLYGSIFHKINESKRAKAEAEKKAKENTPAPKTESKAAPALVVEDGIEEETVAVIMAAISAMSAESGKKLALKSIKKSAPQRSAWASAGLIDNTRPF